jgi:hypothetical protein
MALIISILLTFALLALCPVAQNAPAYDGNYHGVWYPIGTNATPFATTQGRLFKVNSKVQYLTGNFFILCTHLALTLHSKVLMLGGCHDSVITQI